MPREFMHLAVTILSGNSEGLIADAILCVRDWVDRVLLIDTGITDGTVAVAREAAGAKLIVERFAWCNDFALARNVALAKASESGRQGNRKQGKNGARELRAREFAARK